MRIRLMPLSLVAVFLSLSGCASSRSQSAAKGVPARRALAAAPTSGQHKPSCFMGDPQSQSFGNLLTLDTAGYTVGFSTETRTPVWACYRLFHVDDPPELPRPNKDFDTFSDGTIRVTHQDYTNSGYDRGHLAPSSGIGKCYGRQAQLATFTTTNICPQHPGLNQRCWERFERQESDWYASRFGEVWVVTGPIFSGSCTELETDIRVPDAFFKVVVAKLDGTWQALGIIMPNERTDSSPISDFVHAVDEIEELAGIDLFSELPDDVETIMEAQIEPHGDWNASWVLNPVFSGTDRPIKVRNCN